MKKGNSDQVFNFLTFDIEEWYHANYNSVNFKKYKKIPSNLESQVDQLLNLCSKHNTKATFFVVSTVAQKYPKLIKQISKQGHEVASHSHEHKLVYKMTRKMFKDDLQKSCQILEDIVGKKIVGFRAPSWSINKKVISWYYQVLQELGLKYSSSVFPIKTFLYGIPDFPPLIHRPSTSILEIPPSVITFPFKKNLGFSGGFYFRLTPYPIIKNLIKNKNSQKKPVIIYLHPREIEIDQPYLKLSTKEKFIHYYGISGCFNKLEKCLKDFSNTFIQMKSALKYYS